MKPAGMRVSSFIMLVRLSLSKTEVERVYARRGGGTKACSAPAFVLWQ
jgi:hypothetical protein